jgi:DNA-binding MarR family transcriptional regulator
MIDQTPLVEIPGYLIRRAQQVHNLLWAAEVGQELTPAQYAVLAALARSPMIDQHRLGLLASLDKSSVADVVTRLSAGMWIRRERDTEDGRRYVLSISPAASIALPELTKRVAVVQRALLEPLTDAESADFMLKLKAVARMDDDDATTEDSPSSPVVLALNVPGHLVRRAQQVHTAAWTSQFAGDITGPQFAILHVLFRHPGISQRALGEMAALDKSTLADILARLERRDWISRTRDPHDARSRIVNLSDIAPAVVVEFARHVRAVQDEVLRPLRFESRKPFVANLARIAFQGDPPANL